MHNSKFEISRRKFLKTAGVVTLLSNAVVNYLTSAFGKEYFTANGQQQLNLTGIYPNPDHIAPDGIHLRWLFPLDKGFPKTFHIFRRVTSDDNYSETILFNEFHENRLYGENIRFGENFSSIFENQISIDATTHFLKTKSFTKQAISINFNEPVEYIKIFFQNSKGFYVTVFSEQKEIQKVRVMESRESVGIEIQRPYISSISFPSQFEFLISIQFIKSEYSCKKSGWEPIKTVSYISRADSLNLTNFFYEYDNFYLPSSEPGRTVAINKYKKNLAIYSTIQNNKKYENLYKGLQKPGPVANDDVKWAQLLRILFLAIIDPNIARILGLYYVDSTIDARTKYDYKITTQYGDGTSYCGIVLNVGRDYDPLPQTNKLTDLSSGQDFEVQQADESFFFFDKQLNFEQIGDTILRWLKPLENLKTDPAAYFLVKEPMKTFEVFKDRAIKNRYNYDGNKGLLILPIEDKEDIRLYSYADRQVKVESEPYEQKYSLAGIDLYGRVGNFIASGVTISDKSKPAPPINLKIKETSSNNGIRRLLMFNYGPEQYLKSPDIAKFKLFKKGKSLQPKVLVQYRLSESSTSIFRSQEGKKIFRIQLTNYEIKNSEGTPIGPLDDVDLFPFTIFQFVEDDEHKKHSAINRKKLRIRKFISSTLFEIETDRNDIQEIASGFAYLVPNPRNLLNWTQVKKNDTDSLETDAPKEINFQAPIQLQLAEGNTRDIWANVLSAKYIKLPKYDNSEGNEEMDQFTELFIDRIFHEGGIFNNGTLSIINTNLKYKIHAQSSPLTEVIQIDDLRNVRAYGTKVLLKERLNVRKGTKIGLQPFKDELKISSSAPDSNLVDRYVKLNFSNLHHQILDKGHLLLLAEVIKIITHEDGTSEISEQIPITAKLMSDIGQPVPRYPHEALVFISKDVSKIITASPVYFFPSYEFDITDDVNVPIRDGQGNESVYFSVIAEDNSSNHNLSPLSVPAQYINYLPGPPPPSELPSEEEKRYVSLPNKEGRSTILFEWESRGNSIRYELARALDVSIIASLLSKWLQGDPNEDLNDSDDANDTIVLMLDGIKEVSSEITLLTLSLNSNAGIYEGVSSRIALDQKQRNTFIGARTKINSKYFVVTGFTNNTVFLRLLTPIQTANANASHVPIILEKLPDLQTTDLFTDVTKLKRIADACPEAFSMVTKMPIRESKFLDNVPGLGNGKFFYKVRSVDPAENRSEWGSCSDPVYQIDTKPPEVREFFKLIPSQEAVRICMQEKDCRLGEITHVYRSTNITELENLSDKTPDISISREEENGYAHWALMPLLISSSSLDLSFLKTTYPELNLINNNNIISAIYKCNEINDVIDNNRNYLITQTSYVSNNVLFNLYPTPEDEIKVVVSYYDDTGDLNYLFKKQKNGNDLVSLGQSVSFNPRFTINSITGVYYVEDIDYTSDPISPKNANSNLFSLQSNFDQNSLTIGNLQNAVNDKIVAVFAAVTTDGGAQENKLIEYAIGMSQRLKVLDSKVYIAQMPAFEKFEGVYKLSDYDIKSKSIKNTAFNFLIKSVAQFDRESFILTNLDKELAQGSTVAVEILTDQNTNVIVKNNHQLLCLLDGPLELLSPDKFYYHRNIIEKKIEGNIQNLSSFSAPSSIQESTAYDLNPPEVTPLEVKWWDSVNNVPANETTLHPIVRLNWNIEKANTKFKIIRKTTENSALIILMTGITGTYNSHDNRINFQYDDTSANKVLSYNYKLIPVNVSGIENRNGTEMYLQPLI